MGCVLRSLLLPQFAIANLKHYKTRGVALRWRTETEVLDGIGEYTCANQRCRWHRVTDGKPHLSSLEVPFQYAERGKDNECIQRQALVKVVLCDSCAQKLEATRMPTSNESKGGHDQIHCKSVDIGGSDVDRHAGQKRHHTHQHHARKSRSNRHRVSLTSRTA